jgi:hypothetical protein
MLHFVGETGFPLIVLGTEQFAGAVVLDVGGIGGSSSVLEGDVHSEALQVNQTFFQLSGYFSWEVDMWDFVYICDGNDE